MLTIEEITEKLTPVFEANGVTKAILFGSYAKGTATPDSDVDLVIDVESHIRGFGVFGVFGEINDTLDVDMDIISRRSLVVGGKTDLEVARTGKVIYERQG
ncbi:MAG: nucleotidyltransferase domain-containing protein [Defluviitaleaceae bacterium]|nr:nucleotidyltransferase domain-containing protein [Defluviitaleaceae bacterium]